MENKDCCEKCDLTKSDSVYSCANKFCQCHSKAPENKLPALEQASTDESWEESFLDDFGYLIQGGREVTGKVLVYIRALVQKEREEGVNSGILLGKVNGWEAGKSEAFSLVRHRLAVMRPTSELDYTVEYRVAVANFFTLLDTLEGK